MILGNKVSQTTSLIDRETSCGKQEPLKTMIENTAALQASAPQSGPTSFKSSGTLILGIFSLSALLGQGEEAGPEVLPEVSVVANRIPTELDKVGNSVTVLNARQLEREGITRLDEALKFVPGAVSESIGGQQGSGSSLFLRGTVTGQTHIRVDGVRMTGPNITTNNFLGGSGTNGLSTIEILRGPQSALYGGDAIGGVLGLYTRKGDGDPSGRLRIEGGSFDTFGGSLELQGELDRFSYALSFGALSTDNDLPNNEFDQTNYTLRFDYAATDDLNLGMTLRGFHSEFRRPNYADPDLARAADDETDSLLGTIFGELRINDTWSSKLTFGFYDEQYDSQTYNSSNSYVTEGTKTSVYWDNTLEWNQDHTTVAGLVYEDTDFSYDSVFFGLTADDRSADQYGIYLNHNWDVTEAFTLNGGLRWEDYDTYGDEVTWRSGAAYRIAETGTKFRASVGKGFRPPSFIELYGFGGGSNFDLEAEKSIGWDVGIEQEFCDGLARLNITYFENHIEDRIDSAWDPSTFSSTYFNTPGSSLTNGFEVEARRSSLDDRLTTSLNYTYLNKALSGQPEHSLGLRVHGEVTEKFSAGFNVQYLDQRSWGGETLDDYIITNLYASYSLSPNFELNARVENLFDQEFEYYSGFGETYPGRGRGFFVGASLEF